MGSSRIGGTVTASESGDRLAGVLVNVGGTTHRTVTDIQGRYRVSSDPGAFTLEASVLGRQTDRRQARVEAGRATTLHFSLRPG
jgi:iron complex outermembrane receptor protein